MACTDRRSEQIARIAGGRIDADTAADLFEHLDECSICSEEFDLAADLVRVATRAAEPELVPDVPSDTRKPTWPGQPPRRVSPAQASLAAAALLLGSLSLWSWWPGGHGASEHDELTRLARVEPIQVSRHPLRTGASSRRSATYSRGMDAYARGDYRKASELLEAHVADNAGDALAQLYLGIARLQLPQLDDAITVLRAAAAGGTGLLQERALWYWANAELLRGDRNAAVSVLSRLAAQQGDYQPNAERLIESLSRRSR